MTPIEDCFLLEKHSKLDHACMTEIFNSGFSRIPVFDSKTGIIEGLLITKVCIDLSVTLPVWPCVR